MDTQEIYKQIIEIKKDLVIEKSQEAKDYSGKVLYMFRGIDDINNALAKKELFPVPKLTRFVQTDRPNAKGKVGIHTIVEVDFKIYAKDGSFIEGSAPGESLAYDDKSTGAAMSMALKTFLQQVFQIQTEEQIDTEYRVNEDVGQAVKDLKDIESDIVKLRGQMMDKHRSEGLTDKLNAEYRAKFANIWNYVLANKSSYKREDLDRIYESHMPKLFKKTIPRGE